MPGYNETVNICTTVLVGVDHQHIFILLLKKVELMCCLSFAGRVLSQSTPGTPSKTITISESGVIGSTLNSTTQTPNKIAISPLKSPNKVKKKN